ncbi:uncharacterized protein TRIVIDRAFT_214363 [Trichoderma virens Gv29-8]|uniref:JmjC domain-containing protein n=1 Tax=Hypocrea virens (strain Gv29-8 / FGSC 10586) TaxID=413071 RepID=G9N8T4_HYPVG|nr:uncharacterized protein TRIVIDRAFT_214363 [Trichoderma virens Gv29-8]EHK16356.1 hypothetical protein TRIVIDRAFT_214363 [Trichoderma virens Gv29-8]
MPSAQHPQAKFDPIPPDLDLHSLVDHTPNFRWAQRVSRSQIRSLGQQDFEKLVAIHVIAGGKPLVIEGWDAALPSSLFSAGWLENAYDKKQENVRDISNATDIPMTTGHYLRSMKQLTNQWTPNTYRDERRQRLYLKDIDCPVEWRDMLQKIIHPNLFYLNENVTGKGGKRMHDEEIFESETTAAPAGDLMSSLPEEMRAQNLMCYIGHEGTYTPAHREMCASLGQNIMVEASRDENGEKRGSSIWFMTESKDREVVREYFLSMLGHDIEIEKHFAQINAWKKAPFDVYIVEQCVGDFILIPPLAAHQVWNRGTRTMKVAWNRTTVETLDLALHEALPKARLVCRDEQYKNKAIIYYTLQKYHAELQSIEKKAEMVQIGFMDFGRDVFRSSPRVKQLAADFKKLFQLFTEILVDEVFAFKEKDVEYLPFDSCVTCSYCRSNIFNRFLTCKHCIRPLLDGEEDAYDVCMECYAMGRSCACLSGLQWCEQWSWSELTDSYESWKATVIAIDGHVDLESSPHPLEVARQRAGKKSLAQICQEALRRRPWKDITKPEREKTPSDSEQGDGDDKPNKKSRRKKKKGEVHRCHVCCHPDYSYRVHLCTNPGCSEAYCYGVLYRAFDLMPQAVLEDEHWQCPKCLGICNCGHCRRAGTTQPYMPKNTSLGHDTRRIADDRSVEALVDFRIHNLSWLKAAGEESRSKDSKRMQLLREQADNAKAQDALTHAQAEPGMQSSAVLSTQLAESSAINGYGDQSQVLGRDGGNSTDHSFDVPHNHTNNGDNVPQDVAAPLPANVRERETVDSSQYPDPSVFARQRIGMGYYEQDDTPDKILFDPYQAPSVDSMQAEEPTVPEFVKKTIRAAKRKAKRENEDPDFIIPKSHQKRPKLIAESSDFLDNMDPALFTDGGSAATLNQAAATALLDTHVSANSSAAHREESDPKVPEISLPRPDMNEPILRHAKPRSSYVEVDDLDIDELDETEAASAPSPKAETIGDVIPKRRGRPPRNLPKMASPVNAENTPPPPPDGGKNKRRRGRPKKSLPVSWERGDDVAISHDETRELESLDVQEASNHGDVSAVEDSQQRRRPSRPSGVTTIAAHIHQEDQHLSPPKELSIEDETGDQIPKKKRGRPRKSDISTRSGSSLNVILPVNSRFMSMAERMALKGRSFKIGTRKSLSVAKMDQTTEHLTEKEISKRSSRIHHASEEHEGEGNGDRRRTGRSMKGNKVMMHSQSSSSKESTDDEDIPSNGRVAKSNRR